MLAPGLFCFSKIASASEGFPAHTRAVVMQPLLVVGQGSHTLLSVGNPHAVVNPNQRGAREPAGLSRQAAVPPFSGLLEVGTPVLSLLPTMSGTILLLTMVLGVAPQEPAGSSVPPPGEARQVLEQLRAEVNNAGAALRQLQVSAWRGPGASNFLAVADSTRSQVTNIEPALKSLLDQPERLSAALHMYLALQHLEMSLNSLADGARRYQGPQAAAHLKNAANGLLDGRQKLGNYLLALVQFLERENAVTEQELQSCRTQLWKRAHKPARARSKR